MAKNLPSINLLKRGNRNFIDKFIKWALTIGKAVVVLTESIALFTFLYRFSLDRELIDLHDEITQKQAMVKLLKTNEEKYRNFQQRILLANQFSKLGETTVKNYFDIYQLAPTDFKINNFSLSSGSIKIDAISGSVSSLKSFVQKLREHEDIEAVSLDKVENKSSSARIITSITATLKIK